MAPERRCRRSRVRERPRRAGQRPGAAEDDAIEPTVDRGGLGGDLDDAAVEARVADHDHVGGQIARRAAVEADREAVAAVERAGPDSRQDVRQGTGAALETRRDGRRRGGIEAEAGHEQKAAPSGAAQVDADGPGIELGANGAGRIARDPRLLGPDVGGAAGDEADLGIGIAEAVEHLVDRAVAAAGEDDLRARRLGFAGERGGVSGPLRRPDRRLKPRAGRARDRGAQALGRGSAAGGGVEDEDGAAWRHGRSSDRGPAGAIVAQRRGPTGAAGARI